MTPGPETSYRVRGGAPLHGTVFIQGAKNAALKMIAASLLTANGHTVLRNVPPIEDIRRAVELARRSGPGSSSTRWKGRWSSTRPG